MQTTTLRTVLVLASGLTLCAAPPNGGSAPLAGGKGKGKLWIPSPNYGSRPRNVFPDMIIIHYQPGVTADQLLARMQDRRSGYSVHYLIDERGTVYQLVRTSDKAWHAGNSFWKGRSDLNRYSIGIELETKRKRGAGSPFTPALMHSLAALIKELKAVWRIEDEYILGHEDVVPHGRESDPGPYFDWNFLKEHGVPNHDGLVPMHRGSE